MQTGKQNERLHSAGSAKEVEQGHKKARDEPTEVEKLPEGTREGTQRAVSDPSRVAA